VSEATIRCDLEELERAGILERTHGGSDPESANEGMDGRASAELAARNVRVLMAGASVSVEKSAKTK
jgi:DeoR/GlpR family transcriptional regulator of sugar metabolism